MGSAEGDGQSEVFFPRFGIMISRIPATHAVKKPILLISLLNRLHGNGHRQNRRPKGTERNLAVSQD
jgi:hypothetical protein